ncbi:hypothetical protein J6590_072262 [Homalodisca vitripennis]|nr:hypothetical protein J6590_072262 [Homalodisca vitripennis]
MSALQTGMLSLEDCNFTLGTGLTEQEEVAQDLRKVMENMREQKKQLLKQQAGLRATLATLTALIMSLGELFSSQKAFEMPGARSVLIAVAKEVFVNDLHSAGGR